MTQSIKDRYTDEEWPYGVITLIGIDHSSISIPIDEIAAVSSYRGTITIHFKSYNNFLSVVVATSSEDWEFVSTIVEDIGQEISEYKEMKRRDRL